MAGIHRSSTLIISEDRMVSASIAAQKGDHAPMVHIFEDATHPEKSAWLLKATTYLESKNFDWQKRIVATVEEGKTYTGTLVAWSATDMIFRDASSIWVGRSSEVGRTLQPGEEFTYTVPGRAPQTPSIDDTHPSAGRPAREKYGIRHKPRGGIER
jgi:hypothetical protein